MLFLELLLFSETGYAFGSLRVALSVSIRTDERVYALTAAVNGKRLAPREEMTNNNE